MHCLRKRPLQRLGAGHVLPLVVLRASASLQPVLPALLRRVRGWLDLDADMEAIDTVLRARFPAGGGQRVPGTLDGFGTAVRAILGQEMSMAAARMFAQRMADHLGETIATPVPKLHRIFPRPDIVAGTSGQVLDQLGITRQGQVAIVGLARAVAQGQIALHAGVDVRATVQALRQLPGIGDWTAEYIAMRALRWPDAFPAGDPALQRALGLQGKRSPTQAAEILSHGWKPWRSYAAIRCLEHIGTSR
jgi:AraC family transcriptional regulator, regulatory protein of adaptative response / DNA-3-methyladenine glycosylase II